MYKIHVTLLNKKMAASQRRRLAELSEAMMYTDGSDSSESSSDDEDMAILFLHLAFPPSEQKEHTRILIDSLSKFECEHLFR